MGPAKKSRIASVLEADVYGRYHPKSRETRDAHQALLQRVQARLGDHAPDILYSAADEVLDVLKDAEMRVRACALRARAPDGGELQP